MSHEAGWSGMPSTGHWRRARSSASWARSSAAAKSPVMRVSAATRRPDSMRQTASTAAAGTGMRGGQAGGRGEVLGPEDLEDVRLTLPAGPAIPVDPEEPAGPLDRLLLGTDV